MTSLLLAKSKHANRGKKAEEMVQKFLTEWAACNPHRSFERLADAKAAGRTIKAAASDFVAWTWTPYGSYTVFVEVKQTSHNYRLAKDKVSQLPRLRKLCQCGCICLILVHHSELDAWRVANAEELELDKPSWDLSKLPTYQTPGEALKARKAGAFK